MNKYRRVFWILILVAGVLLSILYSAPFTRAATPTRTPLRTPTPTPVKFNPNSGSSTKPPNVMKMINWGRGGGGGPGLECEGTTTVSFPSFYADSKFNHNYELMEDPVIVSCGWKAGEKVRVTIKYPNNRTATQTYTAIGDGNGFVISSFRPSLDDPTGTFQYTFQGNTAKLTGSIKFITPKGAHMYWLGDSRILLYGFAPNERVTLVAYGDDNNFLRWMEVQVGKDGRLMLSTDYPNGAVILARGAKSVQDLAVEVRQGEVMVATEMCLRTKPTRFRSGQDTDASIVGGIKIYEEPDSRSKLVRKMQNQARLVVSGYPICAEGMRWWQVTSNKGFGGYAPEADANSYYLQPVMGQGYNTLFYDDFNGPSLGNNYLGWLPEAKYRYRDDAVAYFEGPSDFYFDNLDGNTVIRMQNWLEDQQRRGWSVSGDSSYLMVIGEFWVEAQFNTMVQSSQTGIDQLIELWIFDSNDSTRYDMVSVASDGYGANRFITAESSISGSGGEKPFNFADNTWYRLMLSGSPGGNIYATVWDVNGTQMLASVDLGHRITDYPFGFSIGISQSVGFPGGRYPTDVAIDWLRVLSER